MTPESQDSWNQMRSVTQMTGRVFDAQVLTLKRVAVALFGHPVTITIAPSEIPNETITKQIQGVVIFSTSSTPDIDRENFARQAVEATLGSGWNVQVCYDDLRYDPTPPSAPPKPKRQGKSGVRGVRGKRKAAAKSKDRR